MPVYPIASHQTPAKLKPLNSRNHNASHASRIYYRGLVGVLMSLPVLIGGFASNGAPDLESMGLETESVKLGRFTSTVRATGDIRTYNPSIVSNDCRARERRVIELTPEGLWVDAGEIICVLDTTDLQIKLDLQRVALIRAKAGVSAAKSSESLQDLVNSRRLSTRRYRDVVARGQLHAYEQAEAGAEIERLEGDVQLKKKTLQSIQEEFASTQNSTALGYRSTAALMAVDAKRRNAQITLENATGKLNLAKEFEQPRTFLELQSGAENARQELDRATLQNKLSLKVTELRTLETQRRLAIIQNQVDHTTAAIAGCTIRAPKAGEVVYCHNRDRGRCIEVGQFVYYRQDLIRISDRSRLIVAARVIDRQAHELQEKQPVEFHVQTNPDQAFRGTLIWIAPMASTPVSYLPYDRYYDVEISVDPDQEGFTSLPLGATVVAEIFVDDRIGVVQVPVKGVLNHHGDYAVLVKAPDGLSVSAIQLGANNETNVEITSGLDSGEIVVIGDQQTLRKLADSITR